jgi:hypothetical protein
MDDVAMIDFVNNGNVPQSEMARANQSDDGLVVLRNGRTIAGHLVEIQSFNSQAVIAEQFGERNEHTDRRSGWRLRRRRQEGNPFREFSPGSLHPKQSQAVSLNCDRPEAWRGPRARGRRGAL